MGEQLERVSDGFVLSGFLQSEPVQNRLFRSLKVWSMYADLEESLGTVDSTKAIYNRIIDLKIATPQIIINYSLFLEENHYFEEAFKVHLIYSSLYSVWCDTVCVCVLCVCVCVRVCVCVHVRVCVCV